MIMLKACKGFGTTLAISLQWLFPIPVVLFYRPNPTLFPCQLVASSCHKRGCILFSRQAVRPSANSSCKCEISHQYLSLLVFYSFSTHILYIEESEMGGPNGDCLCSGEGGRCIIKAANQYLSCTIQDDGAVHHRGRCDYPLPGHIYLLYLSTIS